MTLGKLKRKTSQRNKKYTWFTQQQKDKFLRVIGPIFVSICFATYDQIERHNFKVAERERQRLEQVKPVTPPPPPQIAIEPEEKEVNSNTRKRTPRRRAPNNKQGNDAKHRSPR